MLGSWLTYVAALVSIIAFWITGKTLHFALGAGLAALLLMNHFFGYLEEKLDEELAQDKRKEEFQIEEEEREDDDNESA